MIPGLYMEDPSDEKVPNVLWSLPSDPSDEELPDNTWFLPSGIW